jgi:hypothetical protein
MFRLKAVVIAESAEKVAGESQTCLTVQVETQVNVVPLLYAKTLTEKVLPI